MEDRVIYHEYGRPRLFDCGAGHDCLVKQDCPATTCDDWRQDRFDLVRTHIQYIPLSKLSLSARQYLTSGTPLDKV